MSLKPPPRNLQELNKLLSEDDFLQEINAGAGYLQPAEKILESFLTCYQPLVDKKKTIVKLSRMDINLPVLILGETGTGKELIAQALHGARRGSLVVVNCGGIPESLIESMFFGHIKGAFTGAYENKIGLAKEAEGGTLFLDEIGDLSLQAQVCLLRLLQYKKFRPVGSTKEELVNFRLVSATNKMDLESSPLFRADLYYRIAGTIINLPSLAERGTDDIKLIIERFAKQPELKEKILVDLTNKTLKGNVRQLLNIIEEHNIMNL